MSADSAAREAATRMAGLLADGRGAEILAEMQKLGVAQQNRYHDLTTRLEPVDEPKPEIGIWQAERGEDGIGLRKQTDAMDWWMWARDDYIPPAAGARRLVLVGESAARGWLLDPEFTPARVLARNLEATAPGEYQCVDLARSAADLEDLERVVQQLPVIDPDVVVLFAGNNFTFPPLDDSYRDALAAAVRTGGYPAMRRCFLDEVVLPRVSAFLCKLVQLRQDRDVRIVVVVPESNLRGWVAAPHVEACSMPAAALAAWYRLRRDAEAACERQDWPHVAEIATEMRELDEDTSPVSWQLLGRAAIARGDGAAARVALQNARDAVSGLLLDHVPSIITEVRRLQLDFAARHGIPCVDLADVLASTEVPQLPDARYFLDNCHLSDVGIECAMSAVTDAVLDRDVGTTRPGDGAPPAIRAVAHVLGAAYGAFRNQDASIVRAQLDAAVAAEPTITADFVRSFLAVLESPGPKWIRPELGEMIQMQQAFLLCLQLAQMRGHSAGFWVFRECAHDLLGQVSTQHQCSWSTTDLLAPPDARGFRTPSHAAGKAYLEAATRRTTLAFAAATAQQGVLSLTYRLPAVTPDHAVVSVNGVRLGDLPAVSGWSTVRFDVSAAVARPGVNWVHIAWPVPADGHDRQLRQDASALAQRLFPRVLPTFGAIYAAIFQTTPVAPRGPLGGVLMASRIDTSSEWNPARA